MPVHASAADVNHPRTRSAACRKLRTAAAGLAAAAAITLIPGAAPAPSAVITNGEIDETNQFSNVGTLIAVPDFLPEPVIVCTGTLIAPRVFLTAGHSTASLEPAIAAGALTLEDLWISFGADAMDQETWLPLEAIITHPHFTRDVAWGPAPLADVGAIILAEPVDGVTPVELAGLGALDDLRAAGGLKAGPHGTRFTVAGYGVTHEWPPPGHGDWILAPGISAPPDGLRRYAETAFLSLLPQWLMLSHNHAATGLGGAGFGDSGGPVFWTNPAGEQVQVAMVSRGDPVLVSFGAYYRLDTAEAIDFITDVLDSVDP